MNFIIHDNEEEYLVVLKDFVKGKENVDVFRFLYSDSENDWIEYDIQVLIRQGDIFNLIRIKELSESTKDIIGKIIEEDLQRSFIANPYFDELFIFFGNEVLTSQEKYKQITCTQCQKKNLYEKRSKENTTGYIKDVIKLMDEDKNPDWPFYEKLVLQFSVSNLQSKLDKVDLDNLAKTIFDMFKGVVYFDDNQIVCFAGDKSNVNNIQAFIVGIKRLEKDERPVVQEYLFSGKLNAWREEHKKKEELDKPTRFRTYGSFTKK